MGIGIDVAAQSRLRNFAREMISANVGIIGSVKSAVGEVLEAPLPQMFPRQGRGHGQILDPGQDAVALPIFQPGRGGIAQAPFLKEDRPRPMLADNTWPRPSKCRVHTRAKIQSKAPPADGVRRNRL